MYLLDSNICIAIINENPQVLPQFYSKFSQCYISTIVIAELYKGAYCSRKVQENISKINQFSSLITVINFDQNAAEEFGRIQAELKPIGKPTGVLDAVIAAVARSRGDILVTNNTRHFINIPALQLENWLTEES